MTIKAVLFDIDGTLVDSNDYHVTAWEEAFSEIDARFDRQIIHAQVGKGTDMLVPTLLPEIDEDGEEQLGEAHSHVFKSKFLNKVKPFPGARELLERVQQAGQRVVLASSASKAELEHYIELLDATGIVSETTCSDDVENTKPAPDIFATALKKVAPLSAEEVIVVGDTPYDIEAARKCGIAAIGLRSGKFADKVLQEAGAVASYDDVAALLQDYNQSPLAN